MSSAKMNHFNPVNPKLELSCVYISDRDYMYSDEDFVNFPQKMEVRIKDYNIEVPEGIDKEEYVLNEYIKITKNDEEYFLNFIHEESGEKMQEVISSENNAELYEYLNGVWGNSVVYWISDPNQISDPNHLESIYTIVETNGGIIHGIYKEMNKVCYYTGLFFSALEVADKEKVPLTDVLFRWHFKKSSMGNGYERLYLFLSDSYFYRFGLRELRKANKDFSFITPVIHTNAINQYCNQDESEFLDEAVQNIYDG